MRRWPRIIFLKFLSKSFQPLFVSTADASILTCGESLLFSGVWQEVQPHLALHRGEELWQLRHPRDKALHLLLPGPGGHPALQVWLRAPRRAAEESFLPPLPPPETADQKRTGGWRVSYTNNDIPYWCKTVRFCMDLTLFNMYVTVSLRFWFFFFFSFWVLFSSVVAIWMQLS